MAQEAKTQIEEQMEKVIDSRSEQADSAIRKYALLSTGAGLIPIPGLEVAVNTAIQVIMVTELADIYQTPFEPTAVRTLLSSAATSGMALLLTQLLEKAADQVPGLGMVFNGLTRSAITGLLTAEAGQVYKNHFAAGGTVDTLQVGDFFSHIETQFREGKFKPSQFASMQGQFSYLF